MVCLYQSSIEHSRQRSALGRHGFGNGLHNVCQSPFPLFVADEGYWSVCTHAPGIRAFVVVESALVVLAQGHRVDTVVMHKSHKRKLGALEIILNNHPAPAEGFVHQHFVQGMLSLPLIASYDHTLAGGQPVVFKHGGIALATAHILHSFVIAVKSAIFGSGDAVASHKALGKILAGFDLRGIPRVSKHGNVGFAKRIGHPSGQGRFGPNHTEVDPVGLCELEQLSDLCFCYGHTFCQLLNAGIAWRAENLRHLRAAAQLVNNSMFSSSRPYD